MLVLAGRVEAELEGTSFVPKVSLDSPVEELPWLWLLW